MSKIKYHKQAQKHEAARKVKRMYTKLVKDFGEEVYGFSCYPKIRGIETEDRSYLKFLIGDQYKTLVKNLNVMITMVDSNEDGYYARPHLARMKLIAALESIDNYINSEYHRHEQEFKTEFVYKPEWDAYSRKNQLKYFVERELKDKYISECKLDLPEPNSYRFAPDNQILEATKVLITYQ